MLLRKSQLGMTDFFVALSIFFLVFGMVVFTWNWYTMEIMEKVEYRDMQIKAFEVTELLLKTPGSPSAWETLPSSDNIETLGIAKEPNIISRKKVKALIDSNFLTDVRMKELLNIEIYNFSLKITEEDGSQKYEGGALIERGHQYSEKKDTVIIKRPVLYENREDSAILEFALWEK